MGQRVKNFERLREATYEEQMEHQDVAFQFATTHSLWDDLHEWFETHSVEPRDIRILLARQGDQGLLAEWKAVMDEVVGVGLDVNGEYVGSWLDG